MAALATVKSLGGAAQLIELQHLAPRLLPAPPHGCNQGRGGSLAALRMCGDGIEGCTQCASGSIGPAN